MAESNEFEFVNAANFRVYVDNLKAFKRFLELGVDCVLGVKPERVHISRFCVEHSYAGRPIPKNWVPDTEQEVGGYWEVKPAHYWLEASNEPLAVCTIGSGGQIEIAPGRETFAIQGGLIERVMKLVSEKDFRRDVLPHIPIGELRGGDINEDMLQRILSQSPVSFSGAGNDGGDFVVTGEDLRGTEKMGYTITQRFVRDEPLCYENVLDVGLCKAYYPK